MSTQNEVAVDRGEAGADFAPVVTRAEGAALPRPPMLWLLVPVVLLALLAFLARG